MSEAEKIHVPIPEADNNPEDDILTQEFKDLLASLRHEVSLLRDDIESWQQELKQLREQLAKARTPNQWP